MKKTKIIALTCVAFMLTAVAVFTSCNKDAEMKAPVNDKSPTKKAITGSLDLENYDAQFVTHEDGTKTITFAEAEPLNIHSDITSKLGYSSIVIPAGIYTINVDAAGKSVLKLPIVSSNGTGNGLVPVVGIYIARRNKTHCGTNPVRTPCICGIGLNCGLIHMVPTPTIEDIAMGVNKDDNGKPNELVLTFVKSNIDWVAIEN